jgi:hypothetical protein
MISTLTTKADLDCRVCQTSICACYAPLLLMLLAGLIFF